MLRKVVDYRLNGSEGNRTSRRFAAIVGMNVFLGLRYAVWDADADTTHVAAVANRLLRNGLAPQD